MFRNHTPPLGDAWTESATLSDIASSERRRPEGRNVVVMRTFSKIQGLAGLRIGYGLAPASLASVLQKTRQPFNANSIAQAGALAALQDLEHQEWTKAVTDAGREFLADSLLPFI